MQAEQRFIFNPKNQIQQEKQNETEITIYYRNFYCVGYLHSGCAGTGESNIQRRQ